ncbi:cytochrome P450 [Streptomyces profundus]|uniref:cytochrome P450 n=1 Tax=Streptomyces profundus TaxID=2867410 RepID=UPI001D16E35C|nr:cytochrome P450 [Streptomyces sp. MA3_2.13]UED87785.1 cytochrome P450 [Streptomyces sp. MA3_2.13]
MTNHRPAASGCPVGLGTTDLVDPTLYSGGDPHPEWARLRALDSLSWHQVDADRGFWSVVKYADTEFVLRNTELFTSERGTMLELLGMDDPAGGQQLVVTDPPRHTIMQARLKKALALRAVDRQRDMIRDLVLELVEPLGDGGVFDFAQAMIEMPMSVTGTMIGLPRADWPWLTRLTAACIAADDPEYQEPGGKEATLATAHRELFVYFQDLVSFRREQLSDDLLSVLISTRFEGRHMSPSEIVANCYSLLLGANVTTPHAPNFVLAEFVETDVLRDWAAHPEVHTTAVEESLRWSSPVNHMLRYATRDLVLHGTEIAAGDAVVVWLGSANRDDDEFPGGETFDIRRKPNKHLAFGIGPHYCVGHSVARVTIKTLFEELLDRYEDFQSAGKAERMVSNFVSGYKHVPITARRRRRTAAG